MLRIGDFSKICQVTIKTLRYYDQLGLLTPAEVDRFTGHRYYTMNQLPRLNRILALKELGLSLDEIKQVLDDDLPAQQIRGMLRLKQAELYAEIEKAQARLQRVEARIQHIEKENQMPDYEVLVKEVATQRVLAIREVLPSSEAIPALFAEVDTAIKQHKIKAIGAWMALYHHEGFRDIELDIEIAIPVEDAVSDSIALNDNRSLIIRQTEAYEQVATVIEDGHNESWAGSYEALGRFVENHNYEIAGAVREVYRTAPDDDAGWLIEIQFPLQAKS